MAKSTLRVLTGLDWSPCQASLTPKAAASTVPTTNPPAKAPSGLTRPSSASKRPLRIMCATTWIHCSSAPRRVGKMEILRWCLAIATVATWGWMNLAAVVGGDDFDFLHASLPVAYGWLRGTCRGILRQRDEIVASCNPSCCFCLCTLDLQYDSSAVFVSALSSDFMVWAYGYPLKPLGKRHMTNLAHELPVSSEIVLNGSSRNRRGLRFLLLSLSLWDWAGNSILGTHGRKYVNRAAASDWCSHIQILGESWFISSNQLLISIRQTFTLGTICITSAIFIATSKRQSSRLPNTLTTLQIQWSTPQSSHRTCWRLRGISNF